MDAPDFDELEWMAQQEDPFRECGQDPLDFEQEDGDPGFSYSAELAVGAGQKRSLSPELEPNSLKRGKTGNGESFHDSVSHENDWVLPQEAEWSPASPKNKTDNSETVVKVELKVPMRRLADIEGNFMPITGPSGDRVYAEVKEAQNLFDSLQSIHNPGRGPKHGLLSESFDVLLDQVEQNLLKQACRIAEERDAFEDSMTDSAVHESLWVEKYAPKSFTELLSDEQTNREVLRWLKQWDKCVFGAKKTSTSRDVLAALKRHPPTFQSRRVVDREGIAVNNNGVVGSGSKDVQHTDGVSSRSIGSMGAIASLENKPLDDRPEEKILLLCGPPGLGKTTLAHVAARHCGYRVVEINASDDRVATTLQAKILDAVQMKSVMGDLRPNCVVIDEIDGALGGADGKGAIDALLKIAYAGTKESLGKENEKDGGLAKKASKKKPSATTTLSRPVICICNDPYAPALRQLRQMAKVHVFAQPSINRVVTRLKYICSLEDYRISARALTALADHTECDIRSCLNTLQFLRKKKESLSMLDVASQVVGRKDMTSSAFDVWGEILQKRKPKLRSNIKLSTTMFGKCGQENQDFLRLHDLLANHGDFELMNDGVYDNLTHVRYQDSSLQKTVQCLELLGDSEIISYYALRHQFFTLNVYQPAFALSIRQLVSQPEKPFMEWPKTFQRYRAEHSAKQDLLRSWKTSMQPLTYRNFTAECLAWDLISPLLCILAPQRLRPVAPQLLSQIEKEELNELVDTMIAYGINYKTSKLGVDYFSEVQGPVLYPPIFKLVQFKEYKVEHRLLSSTLRQVLSHEVELEIIRRESLARAARAASVALELQGLSLAEGLQKKDRKTSTKVDHAEATPIPEHVFIETAKEKVTTVAKQLSKAPSKPVVDVFARFRNTCLANGKVEKDSKASNALAQRDSRPIFFKFNEGFTNAIRRPVLIRDLM